jgi:hypothetical protein
VSPSTRSVLRVVGTVGAVLIAVATFVSWYDYEVLFRLGRARRSFDVPVNLWTFDLLAAFLLLAGAVAGSVLLNLPTDWLPRQAGIAAAVLGVAMGAYAAVRCFDVPDLGVDQLVRAIGGRHPRPQTHLNGGPFLALGGSVLLIAGSVGANWPVPAQPASPPRDSAPASTGAEV